MNSILLIEAEIRKKDKISVKAYMDITGLDFHEFIEYIDSLDCDYIRQGLWIIFDKDKVEKANVRIKEKLLYLVQIAKRIVLSSHNFKITYKILYSIAQELYKEGKIKGIFYEAEKGTVFYTIKGITVMIKKHRYYFSFRDSFPEKDLTDEDIALISTIIKNLLEEKVLEGKFDKKALKFSSYDMVYANSEEDLYKRFKDLVSDYLHDFEATHQKLKSILVQRDTPIGPETLTLLEELIKQFQSKYFDWDKEIDRYIFNANRKQNKIYPEEIFKRDDKQEYHFELKPEVQEFTNQFDEWVNLFNSIERKYPSIIFHQKKLLKEPKNVQSKKNLFELLNELKMK